MVYRQFILLIASLFTIILASCNSYYFENPQPIDGEPLYELPKEYHGVWVEGSDTIVISNKLVEVRSYSEMVVPRIYFDTSGLFKTIGKRVYCISKDKKEVSQGRQFEQKGDSVHIRKPDLTQVHIDGQNFLKRVGDLHVLNRQAENQWWEVFTFNKKENGDLEVMSLSKDELQKLKGLEIIHNTEHDFYLSAKWTEKDMIKLLKKGAFQEEVLILETSQMVPQ